MEDGLIAVIGVLLCGALLCVLLRSQRPELALCLSVAAGVLTVFFLLRPVVPLADSIRDLLEAGGMASSYFSVIVKAAGICLATQLTADTCRDAGETALAGKAELVGRVLLLALAVPLFRQILTLATELVMGRAVSG